MYTTYECNHIIIVIWLKVILQMSQGIIVIYDKYSDIRLIYFIILIIMISCLL